MHISVVSSSLLLLIAHSVSAALVSGKSRPPLLLRRLSNFHPSQNLDLAWRDIIDPITSLIELQKDLRLRLPSSATTLTIESFFPGLREEAIFFENLQEHPVAFNNSNLKEDDYVKRDAVLCDVHFAEAKPTEHVVSPFEGFLRSYATHNKDTCSYRKCKVAKIKRFGDEQEDIDLNVIGVAELIVKVAIIKHGESPVTVEPCMNPYRPLKLLNVPSLKCYYPYTHHHPEIYPHLARYIVRLRKHLQLHAQDACAGTDLFLRTFFPGGAAYNLFFSPHKLPAIVKKVSATREGLVKKGDICIAYMNSGSHLVQCIRFPQDGLVTKINLKPNKELLGDIVMYEMITFPASLKKAKKQHKVTADLEYWFQSKASLQKPATPAHSVDNSAVMKARSDGQDEYQLLVRFASQIKASSMTLDETLKTFACRLKQVLLCVSSEKPWMLAVGDYKVLRAGSLLASSEQRNFALSINAIIFDTSMDASCSNGSPGIRLLVTDL